MKVICADDSGVMRSVIKQSVDLLGYEFIPAADGEEAIELLNQHYEDVELVLLDWHMPKKNGLEVLKWIRTQDRFSNIPVMMVTTEGQKENIVEAVKAGARHYLTKPFSSEDLVVRILECLGQG